MPRGFENWLAIGFACLLAPMTLFGIFKFVRGDHLGWLSVVGALIAALVVYDIVARGQLKIATGPGKWLMLVVALGVTGYGGYELYRMHGENIKDVSVMPYSLVTVAWLFAIAGGWIVFGQFGSRQGKEFLTPDSK